jgi:hypothetical protein
MFFWRLRLKCVRNLNLTALVVCHYTHIYRPTDHTVCHYTHIYRPTDHIHLHIAMIL